MWWTKACPKCGGDLFEDKLLRDMDIKCLQCGYVLLGQYEQDLKAQARSQQTPSSTRPDSVQRAA